MEERVINLESQLKKLERKVNIDLGKIRKNLHELRGDLQPMQSTIDELSKSHSIITTEIETVKNNTNDILAFVTNTTKIMGVAKKHWKTILTFGCGIVTTAGFGNPTVQHLAGYVAKFFGI